MGERSCGCPQHARHLHMGSGRRQLAGRRAAGRPGGARATVSAETCPEGPRLRSWADHPEMQHQGGSGETNPEVLRGIGFPWGLWGGSAWGCGGHWLLMGGEGMIDKEPRCLPTSPVLSHTEKSLYPLPTASATRIPTSTGR